MNLYRKFDRLSSRQNRVGRLHYVGLAAYTCTARISMLQPGAGLAMQKLFENHERTTRSDASQ